jgi:hypothetical protein
VRLAGLHGSADPLAKPSIRLPVPDDKEKPGDKGKPGDKNKPGPGRDGSKPRVPGPGQPRPRVKPAQEPMPEIVKKVFEDKPGYANYYFNKLNQDRVWKAWTAKANFAEWKGTWTIAGDIDGRTKVRFQMTDAGVVLKLPRGEIPWEAGPTLNSSLLPAGSGGLLPTLYLWRRLALEGLQHFGRVEYLGTAPLPGYDGLADVLVGSHKGVDCWFYFDPVRGDLLALEMYPADNADPCEVYFSDYRDVNGRLLPGRMEVRTADGPFGVFKLDQFTFGKSEKK